MEKIERMLKRRQTTEPWVPSEVQTSSYKCRSCKDTGIQDCVVETHYDGYGSCKACRDCEAGQIYLEQWKNEPKQQESYRKYKMEKVLRWLARSGVWPRFREKRLESLADAKKLQELCWRYCDGWGELSKKWWGLYFWGNIGAGKTHTATAVCNELIERYCVQVYFVNLWDVADRVKKTFGKEKANLDGTLFEEMRKCELLVLDDIGVENVSDWLAEQIYLVINFRYENNKPIIATSNQSLEDLAKTHRPQICSRLQEMCRVVQFTGDDRRKTLRPDF